LPGWPGRTTNPIDLRGSKSRPELLTCGDPDRNGDFATFGFLNHMISRRAATSWSCVVPARGGGLG
jgi:hypothetical protein